MYQLALVKYWCNLQKTEEAELTNINQYNQYFLEMIFPYWLHVGKYWLNSKLLVEHRSI